MSMRLPRGDELYLYSPYFLTLTHVPFIEVGVFFENGVPLDSLMLMLDGSFDGMAA